MAEADGLNRRRGATDPTVTNECRAARSSSSAGGAIDELGVPFCEGESVVDAVVALPLRCLILYFSIASASRSRIRVAIGDNTEAGFEATDAPPGDRAGKLLVELPEGWAGEYAIGGRFAGMRVGENDAFNVG